MLNAYAEVSQGTAATGVPLSQLLIIPAIFLIFYFLVFKPQKKEQEEHKKMISGLKKNDEIITSGGIYGTIVNVKDNSLVIRVDDNVKIEVQKHSVSTIRKKRD